MLSGDWTGMLKLHTILRPVILRENVHTCIWLNNFYCYINDSLNYKGK